MSESSETILAIGDVHFKPSISVLNDMFVKKLIATVRELKPDRVVFLGDILDSHEKINLDALGSATRMFEEINKLAKQYILIGNHDMKNNREVMPKSNAFMALNSWSNTRVICSDILIEGEYAYVPYLPKNTFNSTIKKYDLSGVSTIFAHQEFRGAQMGVIKSDAEEWLGEQLIISGHIHSYQVLRFANAKVIYAGTPYTITYGTSNDSRGLLFFNGRWKIKSIDMPSLKTVTLTASTLLNYEINDDDVLFTRIVLNIKQSKLSDLNVLRKLRELGKSNVKIIKNITRDNNEQSSSLESIGDKNIVDELHSYFNENHEDLKSTLEQLMEEL